MSAPNKLDFTHACKIGTVPALVVVHGRDRIAPGRWIRIKEKQGADWTKVLVRTVQPDGHFQADR